MSREEIVLDFLSKHDIPYSVYHHPEGKTIAEAKQWWRILSITGTSVMRQTVVCIARTYDALSGT